MKKSITKCPHCGSTEGYYTKCNYFNVIWRGSFDGEELDNTDMYENVRVTGGGLAYCQSCGKVICRTSTIQKQLEAQDRP